MNDEQNADYQPEMVGDEDERLGAPPPATPRADRPARRSRLRRRLVGVGCLLVAGLLCAGVLWWFFGRASSYTATAVLHVAARQPRFLEPADYREDLGKFDPREFGVYKNTQQQLIKGDFVLIAALRRKDVASIPVIREEPDPVRWLVDHVKVDFPGDGEIMRVSLTWDDPKHAAALVDAVVESYLAEVVDKERAQRLERLDEFDEAYTYKEAELRRKQSDFKQLVEALGTGDQRKPTLEQQMALQQLSQLLNETSRVRIEATRIRSEIEVQRALLKQVEETPITEKEIEALVQGDPVCVQLETEAAVIQKYIEQVRSAVASAAAAQLIKQHERTLEAIKERLDIRKAQLREQAPARRRAAIEGRIGELGQQLALSTEQERQLQPELDKYRRQIGDMSGSSIDLEMMKAEIEMLEEVVRELGSERERLRLELGAGPRITLLQEASVPRSPD
jgi:hypothetical protein